MQKILKIARNFLFFFINVPIKFPKIWDAKLVSKYKFKKYILDKLLKKTENYLKHLEYPNVIKKTGNFFFKRCFFIFVGSQKCLSFNDTNTNWLKFLIDTVTTCLTLTNSSSISFIILLIQSLHVNSGRIFGIAIADQPRNCYFTRHYDISSICKAKRLFPAMTNSKQINQASYQCRNNHQQLQTLWHPIFPSLRSVNNYPIRVSGTAIKLLQNGNPS